MSRKPLCVKVPLDIDAWVRALPNSSAWLRDVIVAAAEQQQAEE